MNNRQYDLLKLVAQIVLPVLGSLYFVLADQLNLPSAEAVVAVVLAVDAVLGIFLHGASERYQRNRVGTGVMRVRDHGDKEMYVLELDGDPLELPEKDQVIFNVIKPQSQTGWSGER